MCLVPYFWRFVYLVEQRAHLAQLGVQRTCYNDHNDHKRKNYFPQHPQWEILAQSWCLATVPIRLAFPPSLHAVHIELQSAHNLCLSVNEMQLQLVLLEDSARRKTYYRKRKNVHNQESLWISPSTMWWRIAGIRERPQTRRQKIVNGGNVSFASHKQDALNARVARLSKTKVKKERNATRKAGRTTIFPSLYHQSPRVEPRDPETFLPSSLAPPTRTHRRPFVSFCLPRLRSS